MTDYLHTGVARNQADRLFRYWTEVRGWRESEAVRAASTFSPAQLQDLCDRLDRIEGARPRLVEKRQL